MDRFKIFMALLLAQLTFAKMCINQTISVTVSARNGVFGGVDIPNDSEQIANLTLRLTQQAYNLTDEGLTGYATVGGTYKVSTQLCLPDTIDTPEPAIQILTHGIGFDKTYWDVAYNNFRYSYVHHAVDKHRYFTLSYDRLGLGASEHGEPRDEIQAFLEVATLRAITKLLRDGRFPSVPHKFCKIIHVGHSFGAAQTYALTAADPSISDGIVLTGFAANGSFIPLFTAGGNYQPAAKANPARFGSYPDGYFVTSNEAALAYQFFLPGYFEPPLLSYMENAKQPVTIGEQLTLGSIPASSDFAGPVLVYTGSADLPFCGGDCESYGGFSLESIPGSTKRLFTNNTNFVAYVQPNTGHGMNVHFNATAGFDVITTFLKDHGLVSV